MAHCFVIQPFDGGKFDKRYDDIFAPAIATAGLEPYRVDRDPGVEVPVDDIHRGITTAAACLADITTDNPNVWFELGVAIASQRLVVIVCSKERTTGAQDTILCHGGRVVGKCPNTSPPVATGGIKGHRAGRALWIRSLGRDRSFVGLAHARGYLPREAHLPL
jgi:hypothetical protein